MPDPELPEAASQGPLGAGDTDKPSKQPSGSGTPAEGRPPSPEETPLGAPLPQGQTPESQAGTPITLKVERRPSIEQVPAHPEDADRFAALMVATPSQRAAFFANPVRAIGNSLPPPKYWNYKDGSSPWWPWFWYRPLRFRRDRRRIVREVFDKVADQVVDQTLASSINTDSVFDEFFAPIVKVSQRSYTSVYFLSWAAFIIGVALIGIGTYVGVHPPKGVDSTIVASIFGSSGAISALGSVLSMAVNGIRQVSLDLAKVRVVLTAFATQLGQLRAIYEGNSTSTQQVTLEGVVNLNQAIEQAMSGALAGMGGASANSSDTQGSGQDANAQSK